MPGGSVPFALVVVLLRLGLASRSGWMRLGRSLRVRRLRLGTRRPGRRRHAGRLDAGTTAHAVEEPFDRLVRRRARTARSVARRLAHRSALATPLVTRLGAWRIARWLRCSRRRGGIFPSLTLVARRRRGPLARRGGLPSTRTIRLAGDNARSRLRARSLPRHPGRTAARLRGVAGAPLVAARADGERPGEPRDAAAAGASAPAARPMRRRGARASRQRLSPPSGTAAACCRDPRPPAAESGSGGLSPRSGRRAQDGRRYRADRTAADAK